jgi:uncharacterized peroxidase-related enzyme
VEHHGAGLRRLTEDDVLVEALQANQVTSADLSVADRALLRYAVKLTKDPSSVVEADIEALRTVGFDDQGIHDACQVVAYFNYVNRIADGLGVELEARFADA